jgi:hypothetical protein
VLSEFFQLSGPKFANVPANVALFAVYVLHLYKDFGTRTGGGVFNLEYWNNYLAEWT